MTAQGCCTQQETVDVELLGCTLPPMPKPDHKTMRSEATCGVSFVLCLVVTFVALTLTFSHQAPPTHREWIRALILSEAGVALFCLAGLMWGDPGVIRRNRRNTVPVPPEVAEKLSNAAQDGTTWNALGGMTNISDNGRLYCVRCCIWRDEGDTSLRQLQTMLRQRQMNSKVHHCSTCQRCVRDFDHHCGVFGRCIAGTWRSGNMPYFALIICMGCESGAYRTRFTVAQPAPQCPAALHAPRRPAAAFTSILVAPRCWLHHDHCFRCRYIHWNRR